LTFFVIVGGVYAGFFRLVQIDLKAFIAYSSILHMRFIVYASFRSCFIGRLGILLMRVGHGFISANMFFLLSLIYKETGSRNSLVINRRLIKLGLFSLMFAMTLILKSSAPISIKFVGELFLFISLLPNVGI
jgi:NADH:ubiquinone oxidoreductase subunit 4 (subunit M)